MHTHHTHDRDALYEKRKEWLEARSTHIWDVQEDEVGEYIVVEKWGTRDTESGTTIDVLEGERKEYLPKELTKEFIFQSHGQRPTN